MYPKGGMLYEKGTKNRPDEHHLQYRLVRNTFCGRAKHGIVDVYLVACTIE